MFSPRAIRLSLLFLTCVCCAVVSGILPFSLHADAQTQSQLVPLVTDQTPLALSNQFGAPLQATVNQAGDFAFIGNFGSGLYYRRAGQASATPVLLMGDEVPGFPGSRNDILNPTIRLNSSALLAWRADFFTANGLAQGAIFTFDGTTRQQIISGADPAPGGGGAPFGRGMTLIGLNDSGDIAFSAPLIAAGSTSPAQTTIYVVPAGGAPVRIAGLNDAAPGGGGPLVNPAGIGFNNLGEVLIRSNLNTTGGPLGLFVGTAGGGLRRVAAGGDPAPGGAGTFVTFANALMNNAGTTAFQYSTTIYLNTSAGGNSRLVGAADPVPAPIGGVLSNVVLLNIGDGGDVVFTGGITGSAVTNQALFRKRAGNPMEIVAYRNQAAAGTSGQSFGGNFNAISTNNTGVVTFRTNFLSGPITNGVYQQTGSNAPVNIALDGQPTPLSGGGTYVLANQVTTTSLNNGAVIVRTDVAGGGAADYAEIMFSGGSPTVLMSNAEPLPAGSRVLLRSFRVGASGDSVGFFAQRNGGKSSIAVHSIQNQSTRVAMTDGDIAPGTGGAVMRLSSRNAVFQNTGGTVVFSAQLIGGSIVNGSGIFTADPGGGFTKVAVNGDSFSGRTLTGVILNNVTPAPINDSGQIVFRANLVPASGPTLGAILLWSPGSGLSKIAATGDITSTGATIQNLPNLSFTVNQSGHVAFMANTSPSGALGIFVGTGGGVPAKVVSAGDAGPSGTSFSSFATPAFNDRGEVAFVASLTGAHAGGVFLASTSSSPVAVALDGMAAPPGGNFSIGTPIRPEVALNNNHDVVFRANITGGTSDSGYFVHRGAGGPLQAVALQGQPAPGTLGVFDTMSVGVNGLLNENFQLGPDGDVAIQTFAIVGGQRVAGTWHVKPDNTIEEIIVRGTVAPEFGGGTPIISTPSIAWNTGGRFAMWGRVTGGTFTDVIFLFVQVEGTNTPPGTDVPVDPVDATTGTAPVSLNFDNVTSPGETTLTTASGGPTVPTAFALGDPPVFYNVSTTAIFAGSIEICIDFSNVDFPPGAELRLLHFDGTSWVDATTSTTGSTICGSVASLSPFTVAQVLNHAPVADAGADQVVECTGPSGCSFTLDGTGSTDADHDPLSYIWKDNAGNTVGSTATATLTRPLGSYTFTLTVEDPLNESATATTHVQVKDTTPPALSVSVSPSQIWPANNQMINVAASIAVSDVCDAAPLVKLVSITSNEPLGAGDIQGAAFNTDDRGFQVRATRAGNGSGRTYTVTYRAADHSGNAVIIAAQIVVPHDQR